MLFASPCRSMASPQGLAGEGNQRFGPARRGIPIAAHPAAQTELHRLRTGLLNERLKILHLFCRSRVAPPAGDVEIDLFANHSAHQFAHRLARHATQHVQNGELDPRLRRPEGQTLQLVVRTVTVEFEEKFRFELAHVLAEEERNDTIFKDRGKMGTPVCQLKPLGAVFRTNMDELLTVVLQQAD